MNGMDNSIIFYSASFIMLLFAVLTLCFKNIFYSLISAIVVFFFAGLFFYLLGSEYNAVIQIAIYGVAVPIILGVAVMFTNLKGNNEEEKPKSSSSKYWVIFTACLFVLALIYLMLTSFIVVPNAFNVSEQIGNANPSSISAFGNGIFVNYVWAFELVSVILTIIVAGLTLFKRGTKCVK